jgi:hypothetical protein
MAQQTTFRDKLVSWLEEQGHLATVDEVGETTATVRFKSRGIGYAIRTDEGDPGFLFLILSYTLPHHVDEATALRIARAIAKEKKVVKIDVTLGDEERFVQFAAEQFIVPLAFEGIFWRCAENLAHCSDAYFAAVREAAPPNPVERFIDDVTSELGLVSGEQPPSP